MASQTYIYAGVAGYVGRPEALGKVGVFRRPAGGGEWTNVLPDLESVCAGGGGAGGRCGVDLARRGCR